MDRQISDRSILDKFCEEFCAIVEKHCKYIIVSGFLVIASGRTRGTEDIDMIIEKLDQTRFQSLFTELEQTGFDCMQTTNMNEAYDYLNENLSLRFTWKNKSLPEMEMKFAKDMLDIYQLTNRVKIPLTGLDIWFSTININIAFKEELLKSPKDMEDAKHLRIVYREQVDEQEINNVKKMIKQLRL